MHQKDPIKSSGLVIAHQDRQQVFDIFNISLYAGFGDLASFLLALAAAGLLTYADPTSEISQTVEEASSTTASPGFMFLWA